MTATTQVATSTFSAVLVTHYFPAHGGGVEKVAEQLARRMAGEGIAITWCASDTDPAPALDRVLTVPMRTINVVERATGSPYPLWRFGSLRQLARLVRRADAVHVHDGIYLGSLVASALARRHGKRLVVTQHIGAVPMRPPLSWALALANRLAAHVVLARAHAVAFISPAVRAFFEARVGPRPTFHYVANGVDTEVFQPAAEASESCRQRLGFDPQRPLLLFVGRFVPKKRLHIVREIALQRPDWQWCVIGQGPEQPARWGLANVALPGPMPQQALADYYRAADLLVLPSQGEGFPLVVQEAMACGLPACITEEVAAGSTVPPTLRVELPESGEGSRAAVLAIAAWLERPAAERLAQRVACSQFAAQSWSWRAAAQAHAAWLRGVR